MQFTLAVPALLAQPAEKLEHCAPLDRLARYAQVAPAPEGLSAAMLVAVGLESERQAIAHYAALGAGLDPGGDCVLAADPVTLVAGRDDVLFAGIVDDLEAADANALIAMLDRHFAPDSLRFAAPRPDAWFARVATPPDLTTTPTELLRGPLRARLPQGVDAPRWRRWGNEIQMLLHDHPVNLARESRGLAPVTGVWFWGGGAPSGAAPSDLRVFATAGRAGDLARGIALRGGTVAQALPANADAALGGAAGVQHVLAALAPVTGIEMLESWARDWLAPAVAALERGRLTSLELVADGSGCAIWRANRPSSLARLRARLGASHFVVPSSDDA